jgi:hypothetical protein
MKVYSFHSGKDNRIYGFTPDATGGNLPPTMKPWRKHGEHDVNPGDTRIGVSTDAILEGIKRDGFYLAAVEIKVTITEGVVPPKK